MFSWALLDLGSFQAWHCWGGALCLATHSGAQMSHTVETVYITGQCLQKATVMVSGRDTLSSAFGFAVPQDFVKDLWI